MGFNENNAPHQQLLRSVMYMCSVCGFSCIGTGIENTSYLSFATSYKTLEYQSMAASPDLTITIHRPAIESITAECKYSVPDGRKRGYLVKLSNFYRIYRDMLAGEKCCLIFWRAESDNVSPHNVFVLNGKRLIQPDFCNSAQIWHHDPQLVAKKDNLTESASFNEIISKFRHFQAPYEAPPRPWFDSSLFIPYEVVEKPSQCIVRVFESWVINGLAGWN